MGQRHHRPRVDGTGLQPRGHLGLCRDRGGGQGSRHVPARVPADAARRGGLPRAEPRRAGLRHHLHLGHQGPRALGRLAGRLGRGGLGDHRAGQRGRDRRHLPVAVLRCRLPGRERDRPGRARHRLHRGDDLGLLPGHRSQRANPGRPGQLPVRRAGAAQRARPGSGGQRHRRRAGGRTVAGAAVALRPGARLRGHGRDLVHLHLLGLGRLPGRDRGDQGRRPYAGPGGTDRHGDPAGHLRAGGVRSGLVRRLRRGRASVSATRRTPTTP